MGCSLRGVSISAIYRTGAYHVAIFLGAPLRPSSPASTGTFENCPYYPDAIISKVYDDAIDAHEYAALDLFSFPARTDADIEAKGPLYLLNAAGYQNHDI